MFRISIMSFFLFFCFVAVGHTQTDTIKLTNPSFEGNPLEGGLLNYKNKFPRGWTDCGFRGETPPDVHPVANGSFSVSKAPSDGNTYIGMVVRDNDTWEQISQRLTRRIQKGKCYKFSIDVARSETYLSQSQLTGKPSNYVKPIKLRIYGGTETCGKEELLGETSLVKNTRWLSYAFRFEPVADYTHIVLEAFYNTPTLYPYNGNILIDNASHIVEVPCDGEEPAVAAVEEPKPKVKEEPQVTPPKIVNVSPTRNDKPKILKSLDIKKVRKGQTIRIDKLYFDANSSEIPLTSHPVLIEIYDFMNNNNNVVIEIGGHTNTIPPHAFCDKLSAERARSVAFFLRDKGIAGKRLLYKGYGKRNPLTLDTSQEGRKENQRVEIKILSVNG